MSSMTTPAALTPALAAWLATSSSEAAATFAIAAISSRRAISPMLKGICSLFRTWVLAEGVQLPTKFSARSFEQFSVFARRAPQSDLRTRQIVRS